MREPAPDHRPVVVAVGPSDPRGAAGVEGALKAAEATGAHGANVPTRVGDHPVPDPVARLADALDEFPEAGVLVGELPDGAADAVGDALADHAGPVVVDGPREALADAATLVTASAAEGEAVTDVRVDGEAGARLVGQRLLMRGADAAVVSTGGDPRLDVLVTGATIETARHEAVDAAEATTRGAGVALAAGAAAGLARGEPPVEAVADAVSLVERGVYYPSRGVQHLADLRERAAARETATAVADVAAWFEEADVAPLVPAGGMQVVGATPYAETPAECAAVDGGLVRTDAGVRAARGVRFGAADDAAAFLLAARAHAPDVRFAVTCRLDDRVEAALSALEGSVEGAAESMADAGAAFAGETPVAVRTRGSGGGEPLALVVGGDARTVAERVGAVLQAYRSASAE